MHVGVTKYINKKISKTIEVSDMTIIMLKDIDLSPPQKNRRLGKDR